MGEPQTGPRHAPRTEKGVVVGEKRRWVVEGLSHLPALPRLRLAVRPPGWVSGQFSPTQVAASTAGPALSGSSLDVRSLHDTWIAERMTVQHPALWGSRYAGDKCGDV